MSQQTSTAQRPSPLSRLLPRKLWVMALTLTLVIQTNAPGYCNISKRERQDRVVSGLTYFRKYTFIPPGISTRLREPMQNVANSLLNINLNNLTNEQLQDLELNFNLEVLRQAEHFHMDPGLLRESWYRLPDVRPR